MTELETPSTVIAVITERPFTQLDWANSNVLNILLWLAGHQFSINMIGMSSRQTTSEFEDAG